MIADLKAPVTILVCFPSLGRCDPESRSAISTRARPCKRTRSVDVLLLVHARVLAAFVGLALFPETL